MLEAEKHAVMVARQIEKWEEGELELKLKWEKTRQMKIEQMMLE